MINRIISLIEELAGIKIRKKLLVVFLIITEIIGILVLVWYLRIPLTQKYILFSPKTYSALKMSPKLRYKLKINDHLVGTASANTKFKFFLSPGKIIHKGQVDDNGTWSYSIPDNIKTGKYSLVAAFFNKKGKPSMIKTYKLRVESNNVLINFKDRAVGLLYRLFSLAHIKQALAQDENQDTQLFDNRLDTDSETPVVENIDSTAIETCTDEEYEMKSCDTNSCGNILQICPKNGLERSVEDSIGVCSDQEINPVCSAIPQDNESYNISFNSSDEPLSELDNSYDMGVLVIKYFPITNERKIDYKALGETAFYKSSLFNLEEKTSELTSDLVNSIEEASRYLGYIDPEAEPALNYQIVDEKVFFEPIPSETIKNEKKANYNQILLDQNICDYVDNKGVKEVWIWAYQTKDLGISESLMSYPYEFAANGNYQYLPICDNIYSVYTFNYTRGLAEALESWGHQFEAEISTNANKFFRNIFQGPNYPQAQNKIGRCGSVHNPPNARREYDRNNLIPQESDCLDWDPDGLGNLSEINCSIWSSVCKRLGENNNPEVNYQIWNWQNLPGRNNQKYYHGLKLRNFWDFHGDFDRIMKGERSIFLGVKSTEPNNNDVFCQSINAKIEGTNIKEVVGGRLLNVPSNTRLILNSKIVNDDGNRRTIEWISDGGYFSDVSWDNSIFNAPAAEGVYRVGMKIYAADQLNCSFLVEVRNTDPSSFGN